MRDERVDAIGATPFRLIRRIRIITGFPRGRPQITITRIAFGRSNPPSIESRITRQRSYTSRMRKWEGTRARARARAGSLMFIGVARASLLRDRRELIGDTCAQPCPNRARDKVEIVSPIRAKIRLTMGFDCGEFNNPWLTPPPSLTKFERAPTSKPCKFEFSANHDPNSVQRKHLIT